ncbi:sensor histidine kinase [Fibrella sp. WM1]|uniref:sensor histidine kinase n=1 Tax=Fibrella musci TaxID=3242485 RepID=UPI003520A525
MERPNDVWLRAICIPLVILMTNLLYLEDSHYDLVAYAIWSAVGIGYALLMWEITMRWLLFVRRRYTSIGQTRRRVLITFGGYFVITSSLQALIIWLSDVTNVATIPITWTVYARLITVGLVCVLFVGTFYELTYYIQKYREAVQESEAIKKVGLQRQYDNLKNQVNPHFLFNSLNSLSALITEDRSRAGLFLDELSSVYRYLLQAGQRPLVTLDEELTFLQAYRYLLDTRFGDSLRWEINIGDQYLDQWLPPLSLQTLIENALRHNVLLPDQPLTLHLSTQADGSLVVGNSIQRKRAVVLTQQGGLSLLAVRFEALRLPKPLITDNGQQFVVRLPLARKEQVLETLSLTNAPMK